MNRNKHGINFDEGIPFTSEWEFNNLFVPFHSNQTQEFVEWLTDGDSPILVGGQIGSGKTTFINKGLYENKIKPDNVFHFDTEGSNLSEGDFLRIVFSGILSLAARNKTDLSAFDFPSEFLINDIKNWNNFISKFENRELTLDYFNYKKKIGNLLFENSEYILTLSEQIIKSIEDKLKRPLLFLASGIDKFSQSQHGFHSLQSSIQFLTKYKTIFEVNAIHIFDNKWQLKIYNKIFLEAFSKETILVLLNKRKGIYAKNSKLNINDKVADLSGGNPRQALRLMVNYEFYFNRKKNIVIALHEAIRKTSQDLFAYADEPSTELIDTIDRDKKISASLLNLPGDKDTAQRAVYGNWIIIRNSKETNIWNAIVNPIIKFFYQSTIKPEDYEMLALKKFADNNEMSASGMTYQIVDEDSLSKIHHQLSRTVAEGYNMNLTDSLDLLTDSLLSENRQDRVIITYKDKQLMEAVKAYIFSRAYSYSNPTIINYSLNNAEPFIFQIEKILYKNSVGIYSFTFDDLIADSELVEADKLRDSLLDYQILWWIPFSHLSKYLQKWTQLRQLFQIIILEDEILSTLSKEQIEEDIKFYKEVKGEDSLMVENLKVVLNYLSKND